MKWALIAAGALVALVGVAAAVGTMLPKGHRASAVASIAAPPEAVWALVHDFSAWPSWNPAIRTMERLPDRDGQAVWAFSESSGRITTRVVESAPPGGGRPGRLVTRIDDPDLPFGGSWTWEIAAAGAGTEVRITEDGEVYNPIFRFMARFVFGHDGTLKAYLAALSRRFPAPPR
jgi:hypothetical protein